MTGQRYSNIAWIPDGLEIVAGAIIWDGEFVVKSAPLMCEKSYSTSSVNTVSLSGLHCFCKYKI